MTKDWDAVQDEIRDLSFAQKKPLEEVKELMEKKHKFYASTRAYRMKLKEWGLMRHRPRKSVKGIRVARSRRHSEEGDDEGNDEGNDNRDSSATLEPVSVDPAPSQEEAPTSLYQTKQVDWHIVPEADGTAEPTLMGLLSGPRDHEPRFNPIAEVRTRASNIVLDMLGAILDNDSQRLEAMIVENINHINDPLGLPFDAAASRFHAHPALSGMVIMQHPDQTLLDIACGMPCGPTIWVLLSHGATGSKHPLGTDLALHNAIKNNRPYTVQALMVPGRSDVNGLPGTTWKPLLQAVFWSAPEVVRILLRHGADVNALGPSPHSTGNFTAIQLCLQHWNTHYLNSLIPNIRGKCLEMAKMLLDAGADIHISSGEAAPTPLEMLIRPWETEPHWAIKISAEEKECLQLFIAKGASLDIPFQNFACASSRCRTFEHQVLWHSTPQLARSAIDAFAVHASNNGSSTLHEVLGYCPDAKRHPLDTLRDIEVLVQKGVSPDQVHIDGLTPLMRCIEQCPAIDLVARLQVLLDCGADVEVVVADGDLPYTHAARMFDEPLLSEVMHILISKIRGRYVNEVDDTMHAWTGNHFPISKTQSYEQVMSCARQTGDFKLQMRRMVPEDTQAAFQRAYFSVVSKNYLDTMTRTAKQKLLDAKEKQEIVWTVSMRKSIDLPEYRFDQELVMALLDPQPIPGMLVEDAIPAVTARAASTEETTHTTPSVIPSPATISASTPPPPIHTPWKFNPNNPPPAEPSSPHKDFHPSTSYLDLAFTDVGTTSIRWHDPCAAPKAGDLQKAVAAVLIYACDICASGNLLTKAELQKHETEHAHAEMCGDAACQRRFCVVKTRAKDTVCRGYLLGG
ncbi:hypothetical protein ACN47E_006694 [Coniothyrium glycines]